MSIPKSEFERWVELTRERPRPILIPEGPPPPPPRKNRRWILLLVAGVIVAWMVLRLMQYALGYGF